MLYIVRGTDRTFFWRSESPASSPSTEIDDWTASFSRRKKKPLFASKMRPKKYRITVSVIDRRAVYFYFCLYYGLFVIKYNIVIQSRFNRPPSTPIRSYTGRGVIYNISYLYIPTRNNKRFTSVYPKRFTTRHLSSYTSWVVVENKIIYARVRNTSWRRVLASPRRLEPNLLGRVGTA